MWHRRTGTSTLRQHQRKRNTLYAQKPPCTLYTVEQSKRKRTRIRCLVLRLGHILTLSPRCDIIQKIKKGGYAMRSEAQKRADKKYKSERVKKVLLEFYPTETDMIDHLDKQPKKQTYIKNLIKEDMKKEQP